MLGVDENGAAASSPAPQRDEQQRDAPKQQAQEPSKQAVGANTAAKVPENGGMEQHVEGERRATAADKPGTKTTAEPGDSAEARSNQTSPPRAQNVVDISRGARASAEPAAAAGTTPAAAAPSVRRMARELG